MRILTRCLLHLIQDRRTVGSVDVGGHVQLVRRLCGGWEMGRERGREKRKCLKDINARWVRLIYAVRERHLVLSERMRGDSV